MVDVQAQLEAALETMRAVAERGGAAGAATTGGYSDGYSDEAAEFGGGWYYIDENGEQQGKYSSATMRGWCVVLAYARARLLCMCAARACSS